MYGSWDMEHNGQNFLSVWTTFLLFYPSNNPEKKFFEKLKKTPGYIIILHKCTINDNHMIYGFWDKTCNRQNFFVILGHFLPFYPPLTAWKMKTSQKWKKHLDISSFYTSVSKIMIICYTVPEIWHVVCIIVIFHFRVFFVLFPPNSPKNENFKKMKKNTQRSSFYTIAPKIMIICYTVPETWHVIDVIVIFHFGLFFALLPS